MVEIREVLRRWLAGGAKKQIAAYLGMDPKTVRRYVRVAESCGLVRGGGEGTLNDEVFTTVLAALHPARERALGEAWQRCESSRERIEAWLTRRGGLSKGRRFLQRGGVEVPYSPLHRFAVSVLGFGSKPATLPVADAAPGKEVQVDTGWMVHVLPMRGAGGGGGGGGSSRRRCRATASSGPVSARRRRVRSMRARPPGRSTMASSRASSSTTQRPL